MTAQTLHGTAIAVGERAALIRGLSGAGKSDLALRVMALRPSALVAHQPMLIADDRVHATSSSDLVVVSCPPSIEGLLEVRGIGLIRLPFLRSAKLSLVVDLVAAAAVERMPEPGRYAEICGCRVPSLALAPFEASAPLKLVLALCGRAALPEES